jgi:hypothetical protein
MVLASTALLSAEPDNDISEDLYGDETVRTQAGGGQTTPRVAPLTSTFLLNGDRIDHRFSGAATLGGHLGDRRNALPAFEGAFAYAKNLTEELEGNLYVRNQAGWYVQGRTVERRREITAVRAEAVDLTGFRLQLSLTGRCVLPGAAPGSLCTYTPGLRVDPDSLDPDFLVPSRFIIDSHVGDEISPELQEALKAPGWQRGIEGEPPVGIDLDLPNAGFMSSEQRAPHNSAHRSKRVRHRPVFALSRVEQNLYSNDTHGALDRTVRGIVALEPDEWTWEALAAQIAGWLLPSGSARLEEGGDKPNLSLSNNLFYAANNVRLRADSFTVFHTGLSRIEHATAPVRRASDTPPAWYNSIWLGFSPARRHTSESRAWLQPAAERRTKTSVFAQGGTEAPISELMIHLDGKIEIAGVDDPLTKIDLESIGDLFVQVGLDHTQQEAELVRRTRTVSETRLVPHLSISGNRTDGTSVARYYGGALLAEETNAYVGADYTLNSEKGWHAHIGGVFFTRPNYDYYSELRGRIARTFTIAEDRKITLGTSGSYEIDRPDINNHLINGRSRTRLNVIGQYETGPLRLSLQQSVANDPWNSDALSTTIGLRYQAASRLTLAGQVTPYSEESSYVAARLGLSWRIPDEADRFALDLGWERRNYRIGFDSFDAPLETREDLFTIGLSTRFK